MYAIIHLPDATLVGYSGKYQGSCWGNEPVKPMYFINYTGAQHCLETENFKKSNGNWEGIYMNQSGNGSLQHIIPKHLLEVIEVPDV